MAKNRRRFVSEDEQHVLEHCHPRVLSSPEDIARCDQLIVDHHYLHDACLVGEHLRYALIYKAAAIINIYRMASFAIASVCHGCRGGYQDKTASSLAPSQRTFAKNAGRG